MMRSGEFRLRRLVCGASMMALAAGLASQVQAQAATDEVEEIVVTGFRASLARRSSVKQAENGIVDVINAEDIADFPDLNLAESLQRIPGVAIDRDAGEGRTITVRGLGSRLHPRAPQRPRGAGHHRRHRQLGRRQPRPRLRLQHLRLRAVQPHHRAQERLGRGRRRLARRDGRSADRAAVRLRAASRSSRRRAGRLQRPLQEVGPARHRCCSATPGSTASSAPWSRSAYTTRNTFEEGSSTRPLGEPQRRHANSAGCFQTPGALPTCRWATCSNVDSGLRTRASRATAG